MSQRVTWIVVAAVATALLLGFLLLFDDGQAPGDQENLFSNEELPTPTPAPQQQIILFFLADDGLLHPELRTVRLPIEVNERVRVVMTELLAGPAGEYLPLFPYQVELHGVYVDAQGNAFVDLTPPPDPLDGSHTELLLAYGVVDSILLNCPELAGVQLLFGGNEVPTLTGHLDLSKPLTLNKHFIASL
jgi:hypothetical protein